MIKLRRVASFIPGATFVGDASSPAPPFQRECRRCSRCFKRDRGLCSRLLLVGRARFRQGGGCARNKVMRERERGGAKLVSFIFNPQGDTLIQKQPLAQLFIALLACYRVSRTADGGFIKTSITYQHALRVRVFNAYDTSSSTFRWTSSSSSFLLPFLFPSSSSFSGYATPDDDAMQCWVYWRKDSCPCLR